MSDDLIAFVTARLDEDEATARAATPGPWKAETYINEDEPAGVEHLVATDAHVVAGTGFGGHQAGLDAAHIARHDPARVLREVEAKRAIIREHGHSPSWRPGDEVLDCQYEKWPCTSLRAIAAVWSDHPDYRDAWKPDAPS